MHHGPLWQFFLATAFALFSVQRAALGAIQLGGESPIALALVYLLQALLGLLVAIGIWLGRRWVLFPLAALGALVVIAAILAGPILGVVPTISVLGSIATAILVTGGLFLLLRAEFRPGESNTERAQRSARDPRAEDRDT